MKEIKLKGIDESIFYDQCSNGLEIYVWQNDKIQTFEASITFKVGSDNTQFSYKNKNYVIPNGTAHYLEHILCKNNDGTSLLGYFNQLNVYSNAYTSNQKTTYLFSGTENFYEALDLLLERTLHKTFEQSVFETERNPIIEEARMYKDSLNRVANHELNNMLFHHYPIIVEGIGHLEDIKKIKLDDLKLLYRCFYKPNNSFVVVTGNVNPLEVIHHIKELEKKNELKEKELAVKPHIREPKSVVLKAKEIHLNVDTPRVFMKVKVPRKNFKDYDFLTAYTILQILMDSTFGSTSLFREELLEKHIITYLGTGIGFYEDYFLLSIACTTKYYEEVIPKIKEQLKHMTTDKYDLRRKVKANIANLIMSYTDAEEVNDDISFTIIELGKIIDNEKKLLEGITMKKTQDILAKLDWKEMCVLTVLPRKKDSL